MVNPYSAISFGIAGDWKAHKLPDANADIEAKKKITYRIVLKL